MAKETKKITLRAKTYSPNSQIIELKKQVGQNFILRDPALSKESNELELFKETKYKSDENKNFKDKKVFDSVEIRIIAEQNDLILTNNVKVVKFDETATPKFTDIDTHEMKTPFVGNDKALDDLVQEAIFPYIVLTVEAASGEIFKNDLASICNDPKVKLEQKAEGEAFKAILEIDSAISNVDLSKLNAFEGSKQVLDANGNIIDTVSTVGFDATKDISFKIQVKFRGYEIEHKGSARVAV